MHLSKEIEHWLQGLRYSEDYIIVEGKKDKAALESFGIGNIIELNKQPMYQLAEDLSLEDKSVVILTDLDKKGRELYGKLNTNLKRLGVRINDKPRNFLFKRTKLRQIEGLPSYLEHLIVA